MNKSYKTVITEVLKMPNIVNLKKYNGLIKIYGNL